MLNERISIIEKENETLKNMVNSYAKFQKLPITKAYSIN